MSTHRKNKSLSTRSMVASSHPLWQGALFLTGAVAGAAFLIKSLRLQAEMQLDALHLVREQHLQLSEQVRNLSHRLDSLSAAMHEISEHSENDVASPDKSRKSAAQKDKPNQKSDSSHEGEATSGSVAKPRARTRKVTNIPQPAKKSRSKATSPTVDEVPGEF